MSIYTQPVTRAHELAELLTLVENNPYWEYDCSRDVYLNHIVKNIYNNPIYRAWLLIDEKDVVGYTIVRRDNYLYNEVVVVDICINRIKHGKGYIRTLLDAVIQYGIADKAKRIKWHSHVFDERFWSGHSFGVEVKSYKMFTCALNEETIPVIMSKRQEDGYVPM